MAVKRREVSAQVGQLKDAVDAPKKVIGRNVRLDAEGVEELVLRGTLLSQHRGVTPSLVARSLQTLRSDGGSPSFSTRYPQLRFRIVTPQPIAMHTGALIDCRLGLFGIPFRWRTEITDGSPPHRFVDTQLAGPDRQWVHTHQFQAERDGTRMLDRVDCGLPLGHFGLLATPLIRRPLARIFDHHDTTIRRLLV